MFSGIKRKTPDRDSSRSSIRTTVTDNIWSSSDDILVLFVQWPNLYRPVVENRISNALALACRYSPSEKEAEEDVGQTPDNGDGPVSPLGTMRIAHLLNIIVTSAAGTVLAASCWVAIDEITRSSCEVVGGILVTGLTRRWEECNKVFFDAL